MQNIDFGEHIRLEEPESHHQRSAALSREILLKGFGTWTILASWSPLIMYHSYVMYQRRRTANRGCFRTVDVKPELDSVIQAP